MSAECLRHRLWPPTLTFNKIKLSELVANRTPGRPGLADDSLRRRETPTQRSGNSVPLVATPRLPKINVQSTD